MQLKKKITPSWEFGKALLLFAAWELCAVPQSASSCIYIWDHSKILKTRGMQRVSL
jgi:hypothetical protein